MFGMLHPYKDYLLERACYSKYPLHESEICLILRYYLIFKAI